MHFVGIDAGGTKTDFLLCDENESILKQITLGAGNPNDIGIDACLELLSTGLDALCENSVPDAVFAGVSGGGFGENAERIRSFLKKRFPLSFVDNGSDAINLLYCSKSNATVGALICGTGNVIFIRKNHELLRFGGWGHLFDSGGSAYDFGKMAIAHLLSCEENNHASLSTPLCTYVHDKLNSTAHEALNSIYAKGKTYIASFAPLVFEAFLQGDIEAKAIIDYNVDVVADKLNLLNSSIGPLDEVICAGGLFNSSLFYNLLSKKVKTPLSLLTVPPALGACRRAIALIN